MKPITETETSERPLHPEFEQIYQEHYPMVCAAAYSVLGSQQDAKDVAQDIFLRMAEGAFSPSGTKNLKGYLYKAAINEGRCVLRWRGRRPPIEDDVEYTSDIRTNLQQIPFSGKVMDAVDTLKPKAAKMITLRYAFDYTDEEIAEMLGSSRVMVAMTLSRARKRLQKLMEKEIRGEQ
jgi:RNA polymerase sigma-70 factor (ECF subfamily)